MTASSVLGAERARTAKRGDLANGPGADRLGAVPRGHSSALRMPDHLSLRATLTGLPGTASAQPSAPGRARLRRQLRRPQAPVVFAANGRYGLPAPAFRAAAGPPHQIARRRIAAGATSWCSPTRPWGWAVGEFSTVPADLANQHSVPIVPVGIGTFKLQDTLKLAALAQGLVGFGRPSTPQPVPDGGHNHCRPASRLVHGGPVWWTVQRRQGAASPATPPPPPWRRLWTSRPQVGTRVRIWR
jgi:hypothetical protein